MKAISSLQRSTFRIARSVLRLLGRVEMATVIVSLIVICILTGVQIFLRYGFNESLLWSEEVSLLLMKVMVFLGAAAIYKMQAFICVGFVFNAVPTSVQNLFSVLTSIAAMVFSLVVVVQGLNLYPTQISVRTYLLELPKFYFTVPLIYGAASIFLTSTYFAAYAAMRSLFPEDEEFAGNIESHVVLPKLGEHT
jgi:C4-dicarboxylate transporter DctQ subunit